MRAPPPPWDPMEKVNNVMLLKGRGILTDTRDCLIGNKLAPPPVGWCTHLEKLVLKVDRQQRCFILRKANAP